MHIVNFLENNKLEIKELHPYILFLKGYSQRCYLEHEV